MILRTNSEGLPVILLQARLRWLGFYKGNVTGAFDLMTHNAVKSFQQRYKLVVDGLAGNNTDGKLEALTKNAWLFLFIHYSATPYDKTITGQQIADYHTKRKGWSRPGYSHVLRLDGTYDNIRPFDSDNLISEWEYTFGVRGTTLLNRNARHVCYIGGLNQNGKGADTRTVIQKKKLDNYVRYHCDMNPNLIVMGHNDCQKKPCPGYDVAKDLKTRNVLSEKNLYFGKKVFPV